MIKIFELPRVDKHNQPTVRDIWVPSSGIMQKYASDIDLHPEVKTFISGIKPTERHTFKLITAMGASEYWGQNRNGDRFAERALLLPGPKYGYTSFLSSGVYFHHQNKDPNKSVGKVIFSYYNPVMHRVELVLDYDHDLLERQGKLDYLDLLNPDYSMACKVPWDRCTVCSDDAEFRRILAGASSDRPEDQVKHVLEYIKKTPIRGLATKREHYCEHLRHMMNDLLSDARKVGAWNDFPEFFDISQVNVGAATEAKEMRKVASVGWTGAAELAELWGYDESYEVKLAGVSKLSSLLRTAALTHAAEIEKNIDAIGIPMHIAQEDPLPTAPLESATLPSIMSTLGGMGIVLTPSEFQHVALGKGGFGDLADSLASRGEVFPPSSSSLDMPMGPEHFSASLMRSILPSMSNRSCLAPIADRRMTIIVLKPNTEKRAMVKETMLKLDNYTKEQGYALTKVASLYRGYREQLANSIIPLVRCACGYPEVREALYSDALVSGGFIKGAATPAEVAALGSIFPLLYLNAAHLRKVERNGEKLGLIRAFLKDHPMISATGLIALIRQLSH